VATERLQLVRQEALTSPGLDQYCHRDEIAISCRRISSSANGVLMPFCMEEKRNPAIRLCYHVPTCISSIACHLRVCIHSSRPVRIASETISGITSSIQCWCDPQSHPLRSNVRSCPVLLQLRFTRDMGGKARTAICWHGTGISGRPTFS